MPTFNHFRGDAQTIAQVDTFTAANAEVGDQFTVTINGKDISYTLIQADIDANPSEPANANVVHIKLQALLDASTVPEFAEATWTLTRADDDLDGFAEATHITMTGPDDGTPITATTSTADDIDVLVTVLVDGAAATNEIQVITMFGTGGTWTLTFEGQTTAALAWNITAAALTTAVNLLSNVTSGDLVISGDAGGPYTVEFKQNYAATDVALMTADGSSLTGAGSVQVVTGTSGADTNEIQQVDFTGATAGLPSSMSLVSTYYGRTVTALGSTDYTPDQWEQAWTDAFDLNGMAGASTSWSAGSTSDIHLCEFTGTLGATDLPLMTETHGISDSATITEVQAGSGAASPEVQTVTLLGSPTGGTFTLTFQGQTTATIAWDSNAASAEIAIEGLSNVTDVDVTGNAGGPWTITFNDPSGDVGEMTGDGSSLTGGTPEISTTQAASAGTNEQQRISFSGTPTGGTFTLTANPIGGGDETTGTIAYEATAATVDAALEALAAFTGSDDVSVSGPAGGPWVVTFQGLWASTDVAKMTGSGASLTGTGTQTLTKANTTAASSPHHWDAAENWSLGAVPVTDDLVVIENTTVPIKYGLAQGAVSLEGIQAKASFAPAAPFGIGLPENNPLGYREYRDTKLRIGANGTGANTWQDIEIGQGEGNGAPLLRFDTDDKTTNFMIEHTAASADNVTPAVMIANDGSATALASTISLYRGSVGVGYYDSESGSFATINQAHRGNVQNDTLLQLGDRCVVTTLLKTGGEAFVSTGLPGQTIASITNSGGDLELYGEGDLSALVVNGGDVVSKTTGVIGGYGAITGITAADPAVVTSTAHGLSDGDIVRISGVVGMTEINQLQSAIEVVDANSFQMVGIDASGFTAYSSVGEWCLISSVEVSNGGTLDFRQSLASVVVASPIDIYDESEVFWNSGKLSTKSEQSGEFALHFRKGPRDGIVVYR